MTMTTLSSQTLPSVGLAFLSLLMFFLQLSAQPVSGLTLRDDGWDSAKDEYDKTLCVIIVIVVLILLVKVVCIVACCYCIKRAADTTSDTMYHRDQANTDQAYIYANGGMRGAPGYGTQVYQAQPAQPVMAQQQPVMAQQQPVMAQQQPAMAQQQPVMVQGRPIQAMQGQRL